MREWAALEEPQLRRATQVEPLNPLLTDDAVRQATIVSLGRSLQFRRLANLHETLGAVDTRLGARVEGMTPSQLLAYRDRLTREVNDVSERIDPTPEDGRPTVQVSIAAPTQNNLHIGQEQPQGDRSHPLGPQQRARVAQLAEGLLAQLTEQPEGDKHEGPPVLEVITPNEEPDDDRGTGTNGRG